MHPKQILSTLSLFAFVAVAILPSVAAHNPKVTIPITDANGIVDAAGALPDATTDNADAGLARIESNVEEIKNTPPGEIPVDQIHGIVLDGALGVVEDEAATLSAFLTGPVSTGAHAVVSGKFDDAAYDVDAMYEQTDEAIDHVDEVEATAVAAPCMVAGTVIEAAACTSHTSAVLGIPDAAYATALAAQGPARGIVNSGITTASGASDDVLGLQSPLGRISAFLMGGALDGATAIQALVGIFVGDAVVAAGGFVDARVVEVNAVSNEAQTTAMDLINHETEAANGVLSQVCKAPILPANPDQCEEGSLVQRITGQAGTTRATAESFVNSLQPIPVLQAIIAAVFEITGAEEPQ